MGGRVQIVRLKYINQQNIHMDITFHRINYDDDGGS